MNYNIESLFPTNLVLTTVDENTDELNFDCEKSEYTKTFVDSEFGTMTSQSKNLRILKKYPRVEKILLDKFKKFIKDEYDYSNDFMISTSWITKTEKNEFSVTHSHKNSFWSGLYYFGDYDNDAGCICFYNTLLPFTDYHLKPDKWNKNNTPIYKLAPESKGLIFFPSYLQHSIEPHGSNITRYSLAFNIVPIGEYGENDSTFNTQWS